VALLAILHVFGFGIVWLALKVFNRRRPSPGPAGLVGVHRIHPGRARLQPPLL